MRKYSKATISILFIASVAAILLLVAPSHRSDTERCEDVAAAQAGSDVGIDAFMQETGRIRRAKSNAVPCVPYHRRDVPLHRVPAGGVG